MAEALTALRLTIVPAGSSVRRSKVVLARNRKHAERMVVMGPGDRLTIAPAGPADEIKLRLAQLFPAGSRETRNFFMEMRSALRASPSLADALRTVLPAVRSVPFSQAISNAIDIADRGDGPDKIIGALRSVLPVETVERMIAATESAELPEVVYMLATASDKGVKLGSKIIQALVMPCITILGALASAVFIASTQLPEMAKVFKASKVSLPLATQVMLTLVNAFKAYPIIAMGFVATLVLLVAMLPSFYRRSAALQDFVDRLPIFGGIMSRLRWSRQLRMFSLLLASRQPITRSIELVAKSTDHIRTKHFWTQVRSLILARGIDLYDASRQHQHALGPIDTRWIDLLPLGAKSGDPSSVLQNVAADYEERVDLAMETLPKLLEFFAIGAAACIVGGVMMATMLPAFSLMNAVK